MSLQHMINMLDLHVTQNLAHGTEWHAAWLAQMDAFSCSLGSLAVRPAGRLVMPILAQQHSFMEAEPMPPLPTARG